MCNVSSESAHGEVLQIPGVATCLFEIRRKTCDRWGWDYVKDQLLSAALFVKLMDWYVDDIVKWVVAG